MTIQWQVWSPQLIILHWIGTLPNFGTVFSVLHFNIINWQRPETNVLIKVFVKKIRHRKGVNICLILFYEKQFPGGFCGFSGLVCWFFGFFFFKVISQKYKIFVLFLIFFLYYVQENVIRFWNSPLHKKNLFYFYKNNLIFFLGRKTTASEEQTEQ